MSFRIANSERPKDTIDQMAELVHRMDGRGLAYKGLIATRPKAIRDRVAA